MTIPLIMLGNGRKDCITRTVASIRQHLTGFSSFKIIDDSGDATYRDWLADTFTAEVVPVADDRAGYWRAMRTVWQAAAGHPLVCFWEEDFVLNEPVDLTDLAAVLDTNPHLTQMALLRQPWFPNEHRHGGLIEALEAAGHRCHERTDGTHHWIEHRACFTGNPTLLPARTLAHPWPNGDWSEARFARHLFRNRTAHGAYWGRRGDPPRVTHIGQRTGYGY